MSRLLRKFAFCSKTDTESRENDDVECAVCQDQPTKPCTVPCGNHHVFCQACLQGLVTHNHYRNHFPCPLCRTQVRIPIGGVAAFRQGKGGRSGLLARLPIIRPRCRRSSTDSFSSGWPDDLSLSEFEPDVGDDVRGYNSDSDDTDGLSSMGVPSEGAESMSELNLDMWLNSLDPEQVLILEDIRRGREQAQSRGSERSNLLSQTLDEAVRTQRMRRALEESATGAEGADGEERSLGIARQDRLAVMEDTGDITIRTITDVITDSEDLDMTVVLQLIADMEKNDDLEDTHHATSTKTEDEETEQHQGEESPKTSRYACANTASEATKTRCDSPHPDSDLSNIEDWKLRTIADTAIPRPKLTFVRDTPGERRSFSLQDEEETLELQGPEHLPRKVSDDGSALEEDVDLLEQQRRVLTLLQNATDDHSGLQMDQTGTQVSTDQNVSLESESSDRDRQRLWSSCRPQERSLPNKTEKKTEASSAEHQCRNSPLTLSETSEEYNPKTFSLSQTDAQNSASAEDHPHHSERTGRGPPEDLSPEGWRRQELQKLQAAKLRRAAETPAEDDPYPDTEVIISEGPSEWVRRIRSLQHRRRGLNSKRSVTRSHSHGGKTESGDRGGEREADRQTVEGQKVTTLRQTPPPSHKPVESVEKEEGEEEAARNNGASASNVTVIHV